MNQADNHARMPIWLLVGVGFAVCVFLTMQFDPDRLGNDFAQATSVATNLLAGNGVSTSLVYYDIHYELGGDTVAQTVFPPGHALLLAPLLAVGIAPAWAGFLLGMAALIASAALIFLSFRELSRDAALSSVIAAVWVCAAINWSNVLLCRSEAIFVACGCLLLFAVSRWSHAGDTARHRRLLWIAGAAAAMSFLVRYQGLFLIASLGLIFVYRAIRLRDRRAALDLVAVSTLPGIAFATLSLRNYLVTGGFGGGPIDQVSYASGLGAIVRQFYYEFSKVLGVSKEGLLGLGASELFFLAFLVFAAWMALRPRVWRPAIAALGNDTAFQLCLTYVAVSLAALTYLALTKSDAYAQARYLSALVPFALYLFIPIAKGFLEAAGGANALRWTGIALFAAFAATGQTRAIGEQLADIRSDARLTTIRRGLDTPFGDADVGAFLASEADRGRRLFGHEAQLTGHALRIPVFGLTPAFFSSRVFDDAEVRRLAESLNLRYLVFYPPLYQREAGHNSNRVVLSNLSLGRTPAWLEPLVETPGFRLFEIVVPGRMDDNSVDKSADDNSSASGADDDANDVPR